MKLVILAFTLILTGCNTGSSYPWDITTVPDPNYQPPVQWVQFCPGVTSYPNNYQEGGFCVNGNVYGVYSANNGFLTLLPPGVYNSNAVGNSCTFTLLTNCKVQ